MKIHIPAADWTRFLRLRAEANSAQKAADDLKKSFGLPDSIESNAGTHVLADLTGDEIGKYTIQYRKGEEKPRSGYWFGKLS